MNALEEFDKYYDKVGYFTDVGVAWENTLNTLQHKTNMERDLVTAIDPDAPIRQGKPLHDLDQVDINNHPNNGSLNIIFYKVLLKSCLKLECVSSSRGKNANVNLKLEYTYPQMRNNMGAGFNIMGDQILTSFTKKTNLKYMNDHPFLIIACQNKL